MEPRHIVLVFAYWPTFNIIRRNSHRVLQASGVRVKAEEQFFMKSV